MDIFNGQNPFKEVIDTLYKTYNNLKENDPDFKHLTHKEQREQVLQKFGNKRKTYETFWLEGALKPPDPSTYHANL